MSPKSLIIQGKSGVSRSVASLYPPPCSCPFSCQTCVQRNLLPRDCRVAWGRICVALNAILGDSCAIGPDLHSDARLPAPVLHHKGTIIVALSTTSSSLQPYSSQTSTHRPMPTAQGGGAHGQVNCETARPYNKLGHGGTNYAKFMREKSFWAGNFLLDFSVFKCYTLYLSHKTTRTGGNR